MQRSFQIYLTNKCQWHCSYCHIWRLPQESFQKYLIDIYLPKLVSHCKHTNDKILLMGGEVGMLSYDEIAYVLSFIKGSNVPVEIYTNGLFLKKNYHKIEDINYTFISYHICEDILNNDIKDIYPYKDDIPIKYCIVVHKNNLHKLEDFLSDHTYLSSIELKCYIAHSQTDDNMNLSREDIDYIVSLSKKYPNVDREYIARAQNTLSDIHKKICSSMLLVTRLDFVKSRIYKCGCGVTDLSPYVELNDNNFEDIVIHRKNIYPVNDICLYCNRPSIIDIKEYLSLRK